MVSPELFRHDRQGEQAEHVLFARLAEFDAHGERGDGLNASAFVEQTKLRDAFGHKLLEGKGDVAGADRRAVMKAGLRIEGNLHPRKVIGVARPVGDQRIVAARFVVGGGEQRIVQGIGTHAGVAAQRIAVEVVEGANGGERDAATFWRRRIGVGEMAKAVRVFRLANNGEAVALFHGLRLTVKAHKGN